MTEAEVAAADVAAADPVRDPVRLGWTLFAVALVVFGLTFAVAYAYLALD